jgi:endonuclease III
MNPQKRREIFRRFQQANPNPTTELRYGTPYELLVAVVLSAMPPSPWSILLRSTNQHQR